VKLNLNNDFTLLARLLLLSGQHHFRTQEQRMTTARTNLFLRNDTILGVCEAIGQDFGFNANWLRVALCAALFFSPVAAVAAYFGLGALVAVTRWVAPDRVDAAPKAVEHQIEANDREEAALAA
jgi:phage shock protein C